VHTAVEQFVAKVLPPEEIRGKFIVEAGALDVNGSIRGMLESANPAHYMATDMQEGRGVDIVCMAENLPGMFGYDFADIVVCLEMLEHAEYWKAALAGVLRVLRNGGSLILTTRSPGFPLHDFPGDYWRFSVPAMADIMASAGLEPEALEYDTSSPGVFVKAVKPAGWQWHGIPPQWHSAKVEEAPGAYIGEFAQLTREQVVGLLTDAGIVA
jgi:SAM-dependent methyltransferase